MVTRRWLPDDFDVASVSARNRRAWAEQEAKRASQIGKYAEGVPSSMGEGADKRAANSGEGESSAAGVATRFDAPQATNARHMAVGVTPDAPLHQRAKADARTEPDANSGRAYGHGAASSAPLRSGPQPSPSAPLRDADTAAPNERDGPFAGTRQQTPEARSRSSPAPIPCLVGKTTKRNLAGVSGGHSPKYRNKPTNGYASIKEAKRAFQLKLMQEAGQIRNLREQVPYLLIPKQDGERACSYVADFVYEEFRGDPQSLLWGTVVEDCKGMRTDVYRIKRKLMLMVHGIRIRET